jgi:cbb3-type cytochrome oxidase subunit 1
MTGLAKGFMTLAVLAALTGMGWGIQMSASGDHGLAPAHGHLNLLGWVSLSIFAFYYHLVPAAADTTLAKTHFALAVTGLVTVVPGIVFALNGTGDTLAKVGSVLTVLSMLSFLAVVLRPVGHPRFGGRASSA